VIFASPLQAGYFSQAFLTGGVPPVVVPPPLPVTVEVVREVPAYTNPSVIRIANLALQRIGVSQPIATLEEPSTEARVVRQSWDHLRDVTLQEFAWPFATTVQTLALVPEVRSPWRYAYRLPADCLFPLHLQQPIASWMVHGTRVPFQVEASAAGPILVTDEASASLRYLARLLNPLDWPMWFHDLMAWVLASEIAMPLTAAPPIRQAVDVKLAQARIMAAQRAASTGQPQTIDRPSAFVDARGHTIDTSSTIHGWPR
jgi:hypothetical protein